MSPTRKAWEFGRPSVTPLITLPIFIVGVFVLTPGTPRAEVLTWQVLPNSPTAGRHDDVQFLDPDRGWIVNSSGQVWRTTDGGGAWELQLQVMPYLRSVYFIDESLGFVGTLNAQDNELLYRTTNGGGSWTLIDSLLPSPRPQGICGMMGVGDCVLACGRYYGGSPRFMRSTDRGTTWTVTELSPYARNAIDCYFVSPDSGFVVGGRRNAIDIYPLILSTGDGGQTWTTRYYDDTILSDRGDYCWKIFFANDLVGYVSIEGEAILKTTDGGVTWVRKPVPIIHGIQGIGFATEMLGWVDGFDEIPMVTTDGGDSWETTVLGEPNAQVNRFQMFSESFGYCSGKRIYTYVPGTNGIRLAEAPPASPLALGSHPNPAIGSTMITYVLRAGGPVRVRVYDVLGRYVRTLVDGWQPAGRQAVVWGGEDEGGQRSGRGKYLYRVDAEGVAESRSLVLLD